MYTDETLKVEATRTKFKKFNLRKINLKNCVLKG